MRVAAKAFHFEITKPGVDRVAQRRRWLRRTLKAEHALVSRLAGEPVGVLACFRRPRGIPSQHIGRTLDQLNRLRGNAGRVPAALLRPHSRD
jgi:hypothetical protein